MTGNRVYGYLAGVLGTACLTIVLLVAHANHVSGAGDSESRLSQDATTLSREIAGEERAFARLGLRSELIALLDSMLAEYPLSEQASSWERLLVQCQRDAQRDVAVAAAESLVVMSKSFDYGSARSGQRAAFAKLTLAVKDELESQLQGSAGLPIAGYMLALTDSLMAGPFSKLEDAVFEGEPTTSKHHEHPWVYYWPEDVEYPVPGHVLFNMVRLVERGPNGITRTEAKGGRPQILRGGRATEVQVWLPEGFDPWQAYVDHHEYLDSPQLWKDGLRILSKFKDD